jgi:hypothetical protein
VDDFGRLQQRRVEWHRRVPVVKDPKQHLVRSRHAQQRDALIDVFASSVICRLPPCAIAQLRKVYAGPLPAPQDFGAITIGDQIEVGRAARR